MEQMWALLLVMIIEAAIYQTMRKKSLVKEWVWLHALFCYFAIFILPLLYVACVLILPTYISVSRPLQFFEQVTLIKTVLFWCSLATGHVFFFKNILHQTQTRTQTVPRQQPGLLDELLLHC